jgi:pyrophosphate--fructose-6-phosphate 1-phosphotransferase
VSEVVEALEASGETVPRDPFGHVQLDKVNPGQWFAEQFAEQLGADKVLVQKSGYFSRSAAANDEDLALIRRCTDVAVDCGLRGVSGVVGEDEDRAGELRAIEFGRIKGGKAFDTGTPWFTELLEEIGQA